LADANLLELIESGKKRSRKSSKKRPVDQAAPPSNVVSITDALRRSLQSERKSK
jgi:non-homologous end joining protein Ku